MTRWRIAVLITGCITSANACAHAVTVEKPGSHPTKAERAAVLARAQIWSATDIAAMDLRAGPQGSGAFAPFADVACTFIDKKLTGNSPKFSCELAPGDEVRVKYGERNAETYATVATTRLLWALGFAADRWYPVSVICHGCPRDPQNEKTPAGEDVRFEIAAIERKMPGKTFETHTDEGWKWAELDLVQESAGGATRAQRDALKLLAVMLQHTDSKDKQQRITCTGKDNGTMPCAHPIMFIHDVGLTFGKATLMNKQQTSGVSFENWSTQPVWQPGKACVGNISKSWTGSLKEPVISEAGRKFLADLLNQLTDAQLSDMFEVARFQRYSHVPASDWVAAFKKKRTEIAGVTCPK